MNIPANKLTQLQIDTVRPILRRAMVEKTTPRRLQQECIDACDRAGCPIEPKLLEQQ